MNGSSDSGFTLVELMVTLGLLSLLTLFAVSAVGSVKSANSLTQAATESEAVSAAHRHLRTAFEDVRAIFAGGAALSGELLFTGRAQELRFVTRSHASLERGGLVEVSYTLDAEGSSTALIVTRRLFRGSGDALEHDRAVKLLDGIAGLEFRYFGRADVGADDRPEWTSHWSYPDRLPMLIEAVVKFGPSDPRRWPPTIVRVESAY
jgi:general secretion pathway protein J